MSARIVREKPTQRRLTRKIDVENLWRNTLTDREKNFLWSFTQTERERAKTNWDDLTNHEKFEMELALMEEL